MYKITTKDCEDCPFCDRDVIDDTYTCYHPKSPFCESDIEDVNTVPDWCPLKSEVTLIELVQSTK